ncbi:MAG: hypothetical protein NE330_07300 [Lentisphaeraceae bacterium]|nr:hypothetical protein [Lentisphaeraceae bacterium]
MLKFLLIAAMACNLSAAEVNISSIEEVRNKNNTPNSFSGRKSELNINFDVTEKGFSTASHFKFEIKKVVDSTGKRLELNGFNKEKFQKISRFMNFGKDKNKDKVSVKLTVTEPNRKAESVDIEALLLLRAGAQEEVIIENVIGMKNEVVSHPILKEADITITADIKQEGGFFGNKNDQNFYFKVEGNKDKIIKYELVDVNGKKVSNGTSTSTINGVSTFGTYLDNVPKKAHLKLYVSLKQKTIKVPIRLKKVILP